MNRHRKLIRNILIIAALIPLIMYCSGLYLSPLAAHQHSERSIHYGPSHVVHVQDFEKGKYFLCKYDKWISCDTVNREMLLFWRFGNQVTGIENDISKAVNCTMNANSEYYKVYGIINDKNIKKIEAVLTDGTIFTQTEFFEDMFFFTWTAENGGTNLSRIRGYDSNDIILYEDSHL